MPAKTIEQNFFEKTKRVTLFMLNLRTKSRFSIEINSINMVRVERMSFDKIYNISEMRKDGVVFGRRVLRTKHRVFGLEITFRGKIIILTIAARGE